jgi:hypothetical protein
MTLRDSRLLYAYRYTKANGGRALLSAVALKASERALPRVPWSYQRIVYQTVHRIRRKRQPERYTDADPLKRIYVNPTEISHHVNRNDVPRGVGHVVDGNWDQAKTRFDEIDVYESLVDRYVEGKEWNETDLYDHLLDKPADVVWDRELNSKPDVLQRLNQIDRLYEQIASSGYLSQEELLEIAREETTSVNNDGIHPQLNEIGVNIGREGDLLWRHRGLHRLSIAKILGIETVPIIVLTRHKEWQEVRDSVREESPTFLADRVLSHPDLRDIDPSS